MDKNKSLEELKQDLVSEIEKRVEDKIIEQANADLLIKLINNAETETEAMDIAALGTTYKRTGFHFDKRLEAISDKIRYKTKNKKLSFANDSSHLTHELIIGDNYEALQNLLITHKGKIDVIYIDPPYGKDKMGDFAKTNYENAITRDNLLSMLYPRLLIAKRLLTSEGVIFCSIDDKNQAYVKCLFDEIFEEENFIGTIHWRKNRKPHNAGNTMSVSCEFILVYGNSKQKLVQDYAEMKSDSKGEYAIYPIVKADKKERIYTFIAGLLCEGVFQKGKTNSAKNDKCNVNILDEPIIENGVLKNNIRISGRFCLTDENGKLSEAMNNGNIFLMSNGLPKEKRYRTEDDFKVETNYWDIERGKNEDGNKELSLIFNVDESSLIFKNPKPINLLKKILYCINNSSATILDFFAGSGTTGQAVMELNKQDGGNRTFILCTNNEKTENTPNGIAYDVTTKRLKRVMSGKCYDGTNDFPWLKDHKPYMDNLNVYEIAEVSKTEHKKGETAFDKIDETCYGLPKFAKLTDKIAWICNNFENATKFIEKKEGE